MAWDASFKNILKRFLQSETTEVITETEVPTANLRIDFVIKHQQELLPPFNLTKKSIIVGEFKSERDVFNLTELHKSIAKTYLYGTTEDISEMCLFYLVASSQSLPQKIVESYEIEELSAGVYKIVHDVEIIIVLFSELNYSDENRFLGLFGNRQIRYETIKQALTSEQTFIVSIAYFLYKDEVKHVSEAEKLEIDPITKSIRSVAEELGIPFLIEEIGLSKVIEEVGLSKVIEEVGLSKVIEEVGIDYLLLNLNDQQKKELKRKLRDS